MFNELRFQGRLSTRFTVRALTRWPGRRKHPTPHLGGIIIAKKLPIIIPINKEAKISIIVIEAWNKSSLQLFLIDSLFIFRIFFPKLLLFYRLHSLHVLLQQQQLSLKVD